MSLTGIETGTGADGASLQVPVTVHGLPPGTTVQLDTTGSYHLEWFCSRPDPSSDLGIAGIDNGVSEGAAKASIQIRVGSDGIGSGTVVLPALTKPCPSDYPDPSTLGTQWWDSVRITDALRGLTLAPARYGWDITM